MEKTPFSGITVLGPEDSIQSDNAAFINRDRYEIDRGIKIGVKTHRHDGTSGLSNPAVAPSGLIIGSGGTIPAGISLTLGYSLQDSSGGETMVSPTAVVTTPGAISVPSTAPTAKADYTAGSLDVDTFTYAVTWIDADGGETPVGPSVTVARDPGFAKAEIKLSGLNTGMAEAGATGWRLYRARAGGEYFRLAEGTGAEYVDNGSVSANCDINPPTFNTNTTGGHNTLRFDIPASFGLTSGSAQWINLYCSQAGDFAEGCLLAQVPIGSAGAQPLFFSLELLDAQPPDVNRSYGGANKIDPDTELLDWHWKRPVATKAELPSAAQGAEEGDARVVEDVGSVFVFHAGEWKQIQGAAASGASVAFTQGATTVVGSGITFTGSGISLTETESPAGHANLQIGVPDARLKVSGSGGVLPEDHVEHIEVTGSGGASIQVSEPSTHKVKVQIEGDRRSLGEEGMGVIVHKADATAARGTKFKKYTWIGSVKPNNMQEYDIWIEA